MLSHQRPMVGLWLIELYNKKGSRNEFGGGWTRTNGDRSRGIYSPLQLPLCDTPKKMLAVGLEPTTVRLQVGCSTS